MPLVDSRRLDTLAKSPPRRPEFSAQHILFERAKALASKDQLLLELAFKNNLSVRQIGRIFQQPAGTISRRVQRICARLRDPMVAALLDPACALSPLYRELSIEYFAQGRPLAELADARQMTKTQVRAILNFVRGWYRGVHVLKRN